MLKFSKVKMCLSSSSKESLIRLAASAAPPESEHTMNCAANCYLPRPLLDGYLTLAECKVRLSVRQRKVRLWMFWECTNINIKISVLHKSVILKKSCEENRNYLTVPKKRWSNSIFSFFTKYLLKCIVFFTSFLKLIPHKSLTSPC